MTFYVDVRDGRWEYYFFISLFTFVERKENNKREEIETGSEIASSDV